MRAHCTHSLTNSLIDFHKVRLSKCRIVTHITTGILVHIVRVCALNASGYDRNTNGTNISFYSYAKHIHLHLNDKAYCLHFYLFHFFFCSLFYQFIECAYYYFGNSGGGGSGNCSYLSRYSINTLNTPAHGARSSGIALAVLT